jgi:nucleotide sugar dehydrogenase
MSVQPPTVSVIGAGKMGLPVACVFASRGAHVIVCDVNQRVVDEINKGISPIDEPGVPELLSETVTSGALRATTDTTSAAAISDVVVILVPVLLTPDRQADLAIIEGVAQVLATAIRPGTMISIETTLPVGGTRRIGKIIDGGGLEAGRDFDLVFSPERVKSKFVLRNLQINPKIVGGITAEAAARGQAFYAEYLGAPVDNVGSLETAEFAKLAGMVYRDVNIALANELATYAEAQPIDFERARAAANTDGEAALLVPGIGVGGHCTPVYPHFLINDSIERGAPARLAQMSREINDLQPASALDRIERVTGSLSGRRVVILGLGFRPGVKEHANSPAFPLFQGLRERGAVPVVLDPLYTKDEIASHGLEAGDVAGADVAILVTAHEAFRGVLPALARAGAHAVFDGRRLWSAEEAEGLGLTYITHGAREIPPAVKSG